MFKSKQFIIGLVISLVFLVWALSKEDLGKVASTIVRMNWVILVPALVLYFAGVWLRAVRWRILLEPLKPNLPTFRIFEVVVIGYMANNVLPARIGEVVRAYVLGKREDVRKTSTLATILVERIFDGLVMMGFVAASLLFVILFDSDVLGTGEGHKFGTFIRDNSLIIELVAVAFLAFLVFFVLIASSRARVEKLISLGLRFLPGRLHERAERLALAFIDGLGSLRSASNLAIVFGLSVVAWLLEAGMYYLVGQWGFHLVGPDGGPVPFYTYLLTTGIVNLSTLIPQAPGYIGVFEVMCKLVLVGGFNVESGSVTSYALLLHAALYIPVTVLGAYFLARESLSWRELTDLEKNRAAASQKAHEMEGPLSDFDLAGDDPGTDNDDPPK